MEIMGIKMSRYPKPNTLLFSKTEESYHGDVAVVILLDGGPIYFATVSLMPGAGWTIQK